MRELAAGQRRPGRARGDASGSGSRSRPTRRRGRRSPSSPGPSSRSPPSRGRWPAPAGRPALAVAALVIAPCWSPVAATRRRAGGQLKVVATTTQIGDFVREVGGNAVAVDQILQPNTDPHEYEPRPSDVRRGGSEARLRQRRRDGSWVDKIVSDSGSDAEIVDLGAIVPERLPGESSGAEASRYDPHWWHDPRNAEAAVAAIERHLSAADPSHRREFSATPAPTSPSCARSTPASPAAWTRCPPPAASWSPTTTPSATSPTATGSKSSVPSSPRRPRRPSPRPRTSARSPS